VVGLLRLDLAAGLAVNPLAFLAVSAFLVAGILAPAWVAFVGRVPVPSHGPKWGWGIAAAAGVSVNWAWLVATGV